MQVLLDNLRANNRHSECPQLPPLFIGEFIAGSKAVGSSQVLRKGKCRSSMESVVDDPEHLPYS
jgi:hypothetical protein